MILILEAFHLEILVSAWRFDKRISIGLQIRNSSLAIIFQISGIIVKARIGDYHGLNFILVIAIQFHVD
jgi:hypothetical protein